MFKDLDLITLVLAASTFGFVLTAWGFVVMLLWTRHRKRRLALMARLSDVRGNPVMARELRLWHEGDSHTTTVYDEIDRRSFIDRIGDTLLNAGLSISPGAFLFVLALGCIATGLLSVMLTGRAITSPLGVMALLPIVWWRLGTMTTARLGIFERQLVDGLQLSARALRAGHPLIASFQLIAEEIPEPVGPLFGEVLQQHELGVDLETAMQNMAAKARNSDLRLFSASLSISMRTGGNLADVIDGIANVVHERIRLQRKFRVLTAQTQVSKRILTALPILLFFLLNLANPEYVNPLFDTSIGNALLLVAGGMLLSGWLMMNQMAKVAN